VNNLDLWNKVKQPPKEALRRIEAGRLKGKTDISPQWRYQVMTELFGPCGIGWKYDIIRLWNEPASDGQVFAFAEINLYTRDPLNLDWSDPIPGTGGSMLIAQEKNGLHSSDEGYKMAVTDALSVAMKMLGIAADVYAGKWDGSKYLGNKESPKPPPQKPKKTFAETVSELRKDIGEDAFAECLGVHGFEKIDDVKNRKDQEAIYKDLKAYKKTMNNEPPSEDFPE